MRRMLVRIITQNIKGLMLLSGVITCSMISAAFAPEFALKHTFGASLSGPLAELVVRNWGVLVTLVGLMLIYGALKPVYRRLALMVAVISKLAFIGLVLGIGHEFLDKALAGIIFDSVIVSFFVFT